MKTNNPVLDTLAESQTQIINNWMESARKMQSAFANGHITSEGQSLYKEYFDKQVNVLNNMQKSAAGLFNANSESNPQEFFREWLNQQAGYAKQMADFTQSIQNSVANFGKPAQDYMANFGQTNSAFTNIYNAWLNTLNSTYDALSKNLQGGLNRDVFAQFMEGSQVYAKMQEFFQPMAESMKKGQFNIESFQKYFTPENYNMLTKQMFGKVFTEASVKEVFDHAITQLQQFFSGQQNLSKEYFSQMKNIRENFPQLFNSPGTESLKDFYSQAQNIFSKTFEPVMKLVNPGKEKEQAETLIALMDKVTEYVIKNAELQAFLTATAKKGVEQIAQQYADKYKNVTSAKDVPSAQELFSEWVKVNEQLFTDLFGSEDFSKVKGETLNLSMEVKKYFESQFENSFGNFPLVFKSQLDELNKTIYSLRKQVKEMQAKMEGEESLKKVAKKK
jgi:hypothetical protein